MSPYWNEAIHAGVLTLTGKGDPNGKVTAPVGSTYVRTDGSSSTTFYVKETGSDSQGWVAK